MGRATRWVIVVLLIVGVAAPAAAGKAGRLWLQLPAPAQPRSAREIRVIDRWGSGHTRYTLCVKAPLLASNCTARTMSRGHPRTNETIFARMPGHYTVTLKPADGTPVRRSFRVPPRNGKLNVLAAGDSEIQILDNQIAARLGGAATVHNIEKVGTGLTRLKQYDWLSHARSQAKSLRPDVTVVFIGANDDFPIPNSKGRQVACCGSAWSYALARRAAQMMRSYVRGSRGRVYWFTLPIPRDGQRAAATRGVNRAYRIAAKRVRGVHLMEADKTFTPGGVYADQVTIGSKTINARQPDGIHLTASADAIAADQLTSSLRTSGVL